MISPIIDFSIALLFVLFISSTLVSALLEMAISRLGLRGWVLRRGLQKALKSTNGEEPPKVSVVRIWLRNDAGAIGRRIAKYLDDRKPKEKWDKEKHGDPYEWSRKLYEHAMIDSLTRKEHKIPAYIPVEVFVNALYDLLIGTATRDSDEDLLDEYNNQILDAQGNPKKKQVLVSNLDDKIQFEELEKRIATFEDGSPIKRLMQSFLTNSQSGTEFKAEVKQWFESLMDRVGGWFKSKIQKPTYVVSLVVVVALNINILAITKFLWNNESVTSELASEAVENLKHLDPEQAGKISGCNTGDDTCIESQKAQIDSLVKRLSKTELPIGWLGGQAIREKKINDLYKARVDSLHEPIYTVDRLVISDLSSEVMNFIGTNGKGLQPRRKDSLYALANLEKNASISVTMTGVRLGQLIQYNKDSSKMLLNTALTELNLKSLRFDSLIFQRLQYDSLFWQAAETPDIKHLVVAPQRMVAIKSYKGSLAQLRGDEVTYYKDYFSLEDCRAKCREFGPFNLCSQGCRTSNQSKSEESEFYESLYAYLAARKYQDYETNFFQLVFFNFWYYIYSDWTVILGWLITMVLLAQGAPFWFKLLTRFVNIRGDGQDTDAAKAARKRARD